MKNRVAVAAAMSILFAGAAPAQAPAPILTGATAPAVGDLAPDFTAVAVSPAGESSSLTLSKLRGQVVVLAFYPADRSSGCTAELTKFRDEYAKLFGEGVVVLPISVDSAQSHASWSKDMKFPFSLLVDTDQKLGTLYASTIPGRRFYSRTVFVIGKDGKVTYRDLKFGALSEAAYTTLAAEVAKARS